MSGGRIWGSLFFLFMIFAAMSTVIGIFENLVAMGIEKGYSRKKAGFINFIVIAVFSLPCAFGFNILSDVQPFGTGTTIITAGIIYEQKNAAFPGNFIPLPVFASEMKFFHPHPFFLLAQKKI